MRHGSLFSGIGGFDLAAEWMGWENVFHCDNNEFCQKILKYYWPKAISYHDIKTTYFSIWRGKIDIITGGFPCQPYSQAGKRKGKADDRHLWPEMLRAIREVQPRWVVGENVSGLLNWSKGMVLDEIKADLEAAGFTVIPPLVLPACSVNAPHRRDRVWIIAHSKSDGKRWRCDIDDYGEVPNKNGKETTSNPDSNGQQWGNSQHEVNTSEGWEYALNDVKSDDVSNTECQGLERAIGTSKSKVFEQRFEISDWTNFPTKSPICSRDDGLSCELAGITFPKHRNESIKGYGNAIVPQVAYEIFKTINHIQTTKLCQ